MARKLSNWDKEQRVRDKERAKCVRFAVFEYEPKNIYRPESAVGGKFFKSEKLSQKMTDKLYAQGRNVVTRSFSVC